MFLMFIAGAAVALPALAQQAGLAGVSSVSDFFTMAGRVVWTGTTPDGSAPMGFWKIAAFAWICNLAMHGGLSDMALARQRSAYVCGVTEQRVGDAALVRAWVESDAIDCTPGGLPTRQELPLWKTHQGAYGHDAVFQWGFESNLGRCPRGEYRYRFVLSADGGFTTTPVGNAASSDDAGAEGYRTIRYE